MSLNYVNRANDEEIIDIVRSVLDNGTGKAETANEHILIKLMQIRNTPITNMEFDQTNVDFHYNIWINEKNRPVNYQTMKVSEDGMEWIKTSDKLPDRDPNQRYSQVPCLVVYRGQIEILVFNHEHMVWDDESGDDYFCSIEEVSHWIPLPEPPKVG
jgi:hypothetical protein